MLAEIDWQWWCYGLSWSRVNKTRFHAALRGQCPCLNINFNLRHPFSDPCWTLHLSSIAMGVAQRAHAPPEVSAMGQRAQTNTRPHLPAQPPLQINDVSPLKQISTYATASSPSFSEPLISVLMQECFVIFACSNFSVTRVTLHLALLCITVFVSLHMTRKALWMEYI